MDVNKILQTISVKPKKSINWYEWILRLLFLYLLIGSILEMIDKFHLVSVNKIIKNDPGFFYSIFGIAAALFGSSAFRMLYALVQLGFGIYSEVMICYYAVSHPEKLANTNLTGIKNQAEIITGTILFGILILWLTIKAEKKKILQQKEIDNQSI